MLYDTHCHIGLANKKNKDAIIKTFRENNPEGFLNIIWTNIKSSEECIKTAKKYDFVFTSIWIHPEDVDICNNKAEDINKLEKLYLNNKDKVIGIWECWLDYYWIKNDPNLEKIKEKQKELFESQIELAQKYNLPLIIHNRESSEEIYTILKKKNYKNFVFHCFTENLEYAKKILTFAPESMISFSWILTFKNAKDIQEVAKNIPLKNIILETDSPYLTPSPFRWKEENEPDFTKYILDFICNLRDEDNKKIKKEIFKNSKNFFLKNILN